MLRTLAIDHIWIVQSVSPAFLRTSVALGGTVKLPNSYSLQIYVFIEPNQSFLILDPDQTWSNTVLPRTTKEEAKDVGHNIGTAEFQAGFTVRLRVFYFFFGCYTFCSCALKVRNTLSMNIANM